MITLGIDIGTTSICAALYCKEEERVIASRTVRHGAKLPSREGFAHLMDAEGLAELARQLYRELSGCAPAPISGLCVTGQMHGVLYIDGEGNAVSPLYTWMDRRGALLRADGQSFAEYFSALTGFDLKPGYGGLTHLCNLERGEVPCEAVGLCTVMDYAAMKLCNAARPVTDPTNAASLGLFDPERGEFAGEAKDFFPKVLPSRSVIGHTAEGVPVFNSIGDNQAGVYYALGSREDAFLLNMGTSTQVSAVSGEVFPAPGLERRPYFDGKNLYVGAGLNGGNVYAALKDFLAQTLYLLGGVEKDDLYPAMNRLLTAQEGTGGLQADTRLLGSRICPEARGSISNLSMENFDLPCLVNAVAEGILEESRQLYLCLPDSLRKGHREMFLSGNLLRNSEGFRQKAGRIFALPVTLAQAPEEAAAGAAKFAADSL